MERIQVGEVILFKEEFLGGLCEHELYGINNESGSWVSFNDICDLLCYSSNRKKRMRKFIDDENKCMMKIERDNKFNENIQNEEIFVRDTVVYDIIMKDREERRLTEQFIFDVLSHLNGDLNYDPEKDILKEFILDAIDKDALEEFVIDESKMDYWLDYDENYNEPKMVKREDTPDVEARKAIYRRHRKEKYQSTCPEWLKDVLR